MDIEKLALIFELRQAKINTRIIEMIAKKISTEESIDTLRKLSTYTQDINSIARELNKTVSQDEIYDLYMQIAKEEYDRTEVFYDGKQKPLKDNKKLLQLIQNQAAITFETMQNLSNTTTVGLIRNGEFLPIGKAYKSLIDESIQAVYQGTESYTAAKRRILKELGEGLKVEYESGYRRRLDSSARQNILDGTKQLTLLASEQMGDEFGANGFEISAHAQCAPDHLPYQGRQYTKKQFEQLQKRLDRPFMEWNCTHTVYPIVLGISEPTHSEKQLAEIQRNNNKTKEYQGKKYTPYEATQMQRKIETEIRYTNDAVSVAKNGKDKEMQAEAERKRKQLVDEYGKFSKEFGLETQYARVGATGSRIVKEETKTSNIKEAIKTPREDIPKPEPKPKAEPAKQSKTYTKSELEKLSLQKLRKETEKMASEWYASGKSGISFGNVSPDTAANLLASQGTRNSLTKDYMALKKKLGK